MIAKFKRIPKIWRIIGLVAIVLAAGWLLWNLGLNVYAIDEPITASPSGYSLVISVVAHRAPPQDWLNRRRLTTLPFVSSIRAVKLRAVHGLYTAPCWKRTLGLDPAKNELVPSIQILSPGLAVGCSLS